MGFLDRFKRPQGAAMLQTSRPALLPDTLGGMPLHTTECALYDRLREAVPIIDSAILKIVRLTGDFTVGCSDPAAHAALNRWAEQVKVGASSQGLRAFTAFYLDSLLAYGNAVGEIVLTRDRQEIAALYNPPLSALELRCNASPIDAALFVREPGGGLTPLRWPQLVIHSALNPRPGEALGQSLLRGLPSIAAILLKIYRCIGQNFERMGSVRYAVTYRPTPGSADQAYAKEIAGTMAREWSEAMSSTSNGQVRDFVAVGDVDIRVIGADNQVMDTNIPVRQMLEEIVAKLGLPPFLLGLSWSTTERMSRQQADILTSELESYRAILTPVLMKICTTFLRLEGYSCCPQVEWSNISLQDETELAGARLTNARAAQIEQTLKEGETP